MHQGAEYGGMVFDKILGVEKLSAEFADTKWGKITSQSGRAQH